ncbi:hypothetical protein D9O50_11910 [Oxalobacteraceae bacterium CAVE-383]|nr:hypothetical protein D9O50_11910 [Oxalobacteraceae bacterium CAVE-383]
MERDEESIFNALIKEGAFTNELLGAGATQIRNANYAKLGIYFQAFTSLTTGLERIGKLCLILDYYIKTQGDFPNANYLKNEIGHDLSLLYQKSKELIGRRRVAFEYSNNLDSELHQNIINVLSKFAKGDRYANINFLVNSPIGDLNPIGTWFNTVDKVIFEQQISLKKREKIQGNAEMVEAMAGSFSEVFHSSETGEFITNMKEASFRTGMYEAVAPYRQLLVLQIIRYWVELIWYMQTEAMAIGKSEIPFFSEIFAAFYNGDDFFKSRKIWDGF